MMFWCLLLLLILVGQQLARVKRFKHSYIGICAMKMHDCVAMHLFLLNNFILLT